jgi:hypothetical protein
MRTVGEIADDIVRRTPFLEEALAKGLMNLSALARYIKPEIARRLYSTPTDASIIMALSRGASKLKRVGWTHELRGLHNLSVRSGLVEYAFRPSLSLLTLQKELLSESEHKKDLFVNLSHGVSEMTLIISGRLAPVVEKLIPEGEVIDRIPNLAALTLKLRPEHIYTPGVHYALLKALAWENINVIETISTYSEVTLVVEMKDLSRAFSCIQVVTGNEGEAR